MKLHPTKKLIGYIITLTASLTPAVFVNRVSGYLPFLSLLCCGLLSLTHLLWIRERVEFSSDTESGRRVRGDSAKFTISLKNNSILPIPALCAELCLDNTNGHDRQTLPMYITLAPRSTTHFSFSADFTHIGSYRVSIRKFAVYDLFGLFRAARADEQICDIDILPRVHTLRSLPVSSALQADSSRAVSAVQMSGSDYVGVREYSFGDPIKMIHWKLSAHSAGLMTKQTESYTNTGISIVLDLRVPDYDEDRRLSVFDAIVESGAAIGDWASRSGMDYDLRYISRDCEKIRAMPESFREMDGDVKKMRAFSSNESAGLVESMLGIDCAAIYAQANVALCAALLTQEIIAALLGLRRFGKYPLLVFIIPTELDPKVRAEALEPLRKLQFAGIPCLVVSAAVEL